jgi:plasmid maintenance system antidote protein VapI
MLVFPILSLNVQKAYDLWHAERELADELKRIPTHQAA